MKLARLGNKAVALKLCRNVVLRDFTILRGGHFAIITTGVDNLTVDNVTMDTNRDGIDIDCCRNVMVSNCRINSPNDDALCPKSSFALGRNVITENMTIVNCMVSGFAVGTLLDGTMKPKANGNGNGRLKFGTEANGGFRNCTVANIVFRSCRGLALEEVDGGVLENINIHNITMMDVPSYAIYITTGKRNRGPDVKQPSRMRNVLISNVTADGVSANSGIQIMGLAEQPIEGLRLENIRLVCKGGGTKEQADKTVPELDTNYPEPRGALTVMPGYGVFARHVKGLELANITLTTETADQRPAMVCSDVDGLEVDNFKAQLGDGVAAAKMDGVKNIVIRNSPVLKTAGAPEPSKPHVSRAEPSNIFHPPHWHGLNPNLIAAGRDYLNPATEPIRKEPRCRRTGTRAQPGDVSERAAALRAIPREPPSAGRVAAITPRCAVSLRFAGKH